MASIAESLRNIWKIEELRKRILYTLGILVIYRIGAYVTLPGIDAAALKDAFAQGDPNNLFGFFNLFVGGAFLQAGVFALGIMPYITASIIIQLLGAAVPYFQKLQREGEDGRRKITQITRYGTAGITALQSIGYSLFLLGTVRSAVVISEMFFIISTVIVLTAGTMFVMWLGERITESGIGNGISLIITIGIIAFLPQAFVNEVRQSANLFLVIFEMGVLVLVTAFVVLMTQGTRRIPVAVCQARRGATRIWWNDPILTGASECSGCYADHFCTVDHVCSGYNRAVCPQQCLHAADWCLVSRFYQLGIFDHLFLCVCLFHILLYRYCGESERDGRHYEAARGVHSGYSTW